MGPGRQARASAGSIAVAVGSMIAFGFGLALLGALALDAIVVVTLRTRG